MGKIIFGNYPLDSRSEEWYSSFGEASMPKGIGLMTVIIAIKESDDSLLLGSDGEWIQQTPQGPMRLNTTSPKLHRIRDLPIAIGTSGDNEAMPHAFVQWIQSAPIDSWQTLLDATLDEHARVHGILKKRYDLAGMDFGRNNGMDGLIVGWLEGKPEIVHLDSSKVAESYYNDGFHAIGGASGFAQIVYQSIQGLGLSPLDQMHRILDNLIFALPTIGGPKTIWRITKGGIEVVHEGKSEAPNQESV